MDQSRRILLRQKKAELKQKHEILEGPTYESKAFIDDCIHSSIELLTVNNKDEFFIVSFDLETGSFPSDCDILQIAAKHQHYVFSTYIRPSQAISDQSSRSHGLTFINGYSLAYGKVVLSYKKHLLACINTYTAS